MEQSDDDALLMQRYARGDTRAFDLLYARHRAPLWRYVQRQLAGAPAAHDVFQETWSRVVAHRAQYAPTAPFGTWLYRIAHNCCVDHWRSQARRAGRETAVDDEFLQSFGDDSAGPEQHALDCDDGQRLEQALARLPPAQRGAFLLHVEAGLSVEEIGAATGVGAETAKSRLRYAVAKLKSLLAGAEEQS
jgi:RNA polymerase sigma-70 factor, ECF subfamily